MNKKYVFLIIGLLILGVGIFLSVQKTDPESTIRSAMIIANDKPLNFSLVPLEEDWDKLCIFGPYTSNKAASDVLGFDWPIEKNSHVTYGDSVTALVFVSQSKVVYTFDIERNLADFYKVYNQCYPREKAVFIKKNGHYQLHQK